MDSNGDSDTSDSGSILPPPQHNDIVDGQYKLVEVIGRGGSGEVWRAIRASTGQAFAIKIMYSSGRSMKVSHAQYINDILSHSPSPHADMFGTLVETSMHLRRECIVFEIYGFSIRDILRKQYLTPIPAFQCSAILWQVCNGIAFLHGLQIAHTDIKPENILLVDDSMTSVRHINSDGKFFDKRILRNIEVKIIDLEDSVFRPQNFQYRHGTAGYYAPEVYGKNGWSYPVDVFAIGCLTFEIFTGVPLLPWVDDVKEYFYCFERCIDHLRAPQARDINNTHPGLFRITGNSARVRVESLNPNRRNLLWRMVSDTLWEKSRSLQNTEVKQFITRCTQPDPHKRLLMKSTLFQPIFSRFTKEHPMAEMSDSDY